jgi:hypothetical protein
VWKVKLRAENVHLDAIPAERVDEQTHKLVEALEREWAAAGRPWAAAVGAEGGGAADAIAELSAAELEALDAQQLASEIAQVRRPIDRTRDLSICAAALLTLHVYVYVCVYVCVHVCVFTA